MTTTDVRDRVNSDFTCLLRAGHGSEFRIPLPATHTPANSSSGGRAKTAATQAPANAGARKTSTSPPRETIDAPNTNTSTATPPTAPQLHPQPCRLGAAIRPPTTDHTIRQDTVVTRETFLDDWYTTPQGRTWLQTYTHFEKLHTESANTGTRAAARRTLDELDESLAYLLNNHYHDWDETQPEPVPLHNQ